MSFFVIKRRTIVSIILAVLSVAALAVTLIAISSPAQASPAIPYTVVIDAGHGGRDGGVTGAVTDVKESEINLDIAKKLQAFLEKHGFKVVMTRTNSEGLYGMNSSNRKMADMRKREEIINNAAPDLVISIHQNSFPSPSERGAQVFYSPHSEAGKTAAKVMQDCLKAGLPESGRTIRPGDYFILECSPCAAVIVECGFLSSAEDEKLLSQDVYREKVAYAIFSGVLGIYYYNP